MHDDRILVEGRLDRVLRERIRPAVYRDPVPLAIACWEAGDPVPVADGLAAPYQTVQIGHWWGAPWRTVWFRLSGAVPEAWRGETVEAVVDLGFAVDRPGFSAEGLAYTVDGAPL
jgi:alpha-mannosidase